MQKCDLSTIGACDGSSGGAATLSGCSADFVVSAGIVESIDLAIAELVVVDELQYEAHA